MAASQDVVLLKTKDNIGNICPMLFISLQRYVIYPAVFSINLVTSSPKPVLPKMRAPCHERLLLRKKRFLLQFLWSIKTHRLCVCAAELCFLTGFIYFLTSSFGMLSLPALHKLFPALFSQILNAFFADLSVFPPSSSLVVIHSVAPQQACRAGVRGKIGEKAPVPSAAKDKIPLAGGGDGQRLQDRKSVV